MANTALRDRNRRATMNDVQRVAVGLMRQHGFANVTVEAISAAAGVSASTIYRYFGTKEALVLWGDRPARLVEAFSAAQGGKGAKRGTSQAAFIDAAIATYSQREADLLSQLRLVFHSEDLTAAFEHQLIGRRHEVAAVFAAHGERRHKKKSERVQVRLRDRAAAGAALGMLVAVLDHWQAAEGAKSLPKLLAKGSTAIQ